MKVLTFYVNQFSYTPAEKNLEDTAIVTDGENFEESILAFIQVEEADEALDAKSREKKLVNHLKWVARKNNTRQIILHSFAHLSDSKASAEFTKNIFDLAEKRLRNGEYIVAQTPYGYFLNLNIQAPGFSLARIWANL